MAGTTTYYGISYPTNTDYVKDGATAMQTIADGFDSAVAIPTYNNQTGTSYTFVLADAGKTVTSNNASAVTFTIPPQASVAWANNTTLTVRNLGAGVVTIAGGSGVSVTNTAQTVAQYGEVKLIRTASNAWTVVPASGGTSGLTLISANTFTTQSSVSVNNCFSSTYTNYRLIVLINSSSVTNNEVKFRFRTGTTDNTTTNYSQAAFSITAGAATNTNFTANKNNTTVGYTDPNMTSGSFDIFNPNNSFTTDITGLFTYGISGQYGNAASFTNTRFGLTTVFDGFTIYPETGTFSGSVRLYGYQNS